MNYKYSKHHNNKVKQKEANFICKNYGKYGTPTLAKLLNINKKAILTCLKLNSIKTKPLGFYLKGKKSINNLANPIYSYNVKNVIKDYHKFKNTKKLALKYNSSISATQKYLKKHKIELYSKSKNIIKNKDNIIKFYKTKNATEIAKIYNTHCGIITFYLKKWGIKLKTLSEIMHKNSRYINSDGYILITLKDADKHFSNRKRNQELEHRLIMARFLNRPLLPTEQVDHKNGVRTDNRLENLELYSTAHGAGQDVQHTIQRSIDDILRLGNEYLTGKHGKVKMNAKYKKQLKQMMGAK